MVCTWVFKSGCCSWVAEYRGGCGEAGMECSGGVTGGVTGGVEWIEPTSGVGGVGGRVVYPGRYGFCEANGRSSEVNCGEPIGDKAECLSSPTSISTNRLSCSGSSGSWNALINCWRTLLLRVL